MRAVILERQGSLDDLKYVPDFPDPIVTDHHVGIPVKASSFNYHDVFTVRGMPGIKIPLPIIIAISQARLWRSVPASKTGKPAIVCP
jgi:NADPH:quinone reductase-like Zn-dependent oxidoreductase